MHVTTCYNLPLRVYEVNDVEISEYHACMHAMYAGKTIK
jgi:hypothetical protein